MALRTDDYATQVFIVTTVYDVLLTLWNYLTVQTIATMLQVMVAVRVIVVCFKTDFYYFGLRV